MSNEQRYRKALEEIAEGYHRADDTALVCAEIASAALNATEGDFADRIEDAIEDGHAFAAGQQNERARVVAIIRDACFTGIGPRNPNPTWQDIIDTIQTNKEGG